MMEAGGQNGMMNVGFVLFLFFSVDFGHSAEESRGAETADGPIVIDV